MSDRVPKPKLVLLSTAFLCATVTNIPAQVSDKNPIISKNLTPKDVVAASKPVERSDQADLPLGPTQIYKIGVGDVLIVELKNATNAAGYYTVMDDGTLDLPLLTTPITITGKTPDEAAKAIAAGITLYANAKVEVRIREYRSHRIKVTGLVEMAGAHSLKREALPLYVVRAEVRVDPRVTHAVVRRNDTGLVATLDLRAPDADNVLIYPGDSVEFTAETRMPGLANGAFFYIAGAVNSIGRMEFTPGMTLSQAIAVSGGLKGSPKQASLRRITSNGTISIAEYNLRSIKEGKTADPVLLPGDMIEIGN